MNRNKRKPRILIAKPGLDCHDRGAKIIALSLRDAGMEVIYTGIRRTPEQIVSTAIQEDVDIIGLSILSGAYMKLVPKIFALLGQSDAHDIKVILGGTIPQKDIEKLQEMGVAHVFQPGDGIQEIIASVRETALGTKVHHKGSDSVPSS